MKTFLTKVLSGITQNLLYPQQTKSEAKLESPEKGFPLWSFKIQLNRETMNNVLIKLLIQVKKTGDESLRDTFYRILMNRVLDNFYLIGLTYFASQSEKMVALFCADLLMENTLDNLPTSGDDDLECYFLACFTSFCKEFVKNKKILN